MRHWIIGLLLLSCFGLATATPASTTVVFDVENMTCMACNITIEKALDRVPGVTAIQANSNTATVRVSFDADRTTPAAVGDAITNAGFPAEARTAADD